MSAIPQFQARESEAFLGADPEVSLPIPTQGRDNPLQLLRDAIAGLKSSNGDLADQTQLANLLAEAKEALERANAIARALAQCEEFVRQTQFDLALNALDVALVVYPADHAMVTRRREVEDQQRAFQDAAVLQTALQEADWLLQQQRPDLAVNFLREKAAEFPDQSPLVSRLEELEALLPEWDQKRNVQEAMSRAASLEQLKQCQSALTILEEALKSYPASHDLLDAARRIRDLVMDQERQKRLARRLELIGQSIAAQSWRQALTLLENTQIEFPGAQELKALRREVIAGLRRSECDEIVLEIRQCLVDGDFEQAELILHRGLAALGSEPALEALREELETGRKYQDDLRTAQVLFGQRQLQEAERILTEIVTPDRPEARALLEAVREASAATEEETFCERGREKALELIQQEQFAQAVDLLRNLLSLFPGNSILERELGVAQSGLDRKAGAAAPVPEPDPIEAEPEDEPQTVPVVAAEVRAGAPSRVRRAAVAGAASLVLVSAAGAAWKLSRTSAPVSQPAAKPAAQSPVRVPATQEAATANPAPAQEAAVSSTPTPAASQPATTNAKTIARPAPAAPAPTPLRQFVPPVPERRTAQNSLPLPPGAQGGVSAESIPGLPAALDKPAIGPSPPPAPAPPPVVTPAPAPAPVVSGGKFQEAQLVTRVLPTYPALARQRALFGPVKMEAVIDDQGSVKSVKVLSGDPILAAAARLAVDKWKYKPALLNGKPIPSNVVIQVLFGEQNK